METTKRILASNLAMQLEQQRLQLDVVNNKGTKLQGSAVAEALDDNDSVQINFDAGVRTALAGEGRAERIAELKKLIADGKYRPKAKEVAAALASAIDDEIAISKLEGDF